MVRASFLLVGLGFLAGWPPIAIAENSYAPVIATYGGQRTALGGKNKRNANILSDLLLSPIANAASNSVTRRHLAILDSLNVDYDIELTFALRCIGLEHVGQDCRNVHAIGVGDLYPDIETLRTSKNDELVAVLVDVGFQFDARRFYHRANITFAGLDYEDFVYPEPTYPNILVNYRTSKAPSTAKRDPIYRNPDNTKEIEKKAASREYWFGGDPSVAQSAVRTAISQFSLIADTILKSHKVRGAIPDLDVWYESLPTGNEAAMANGFDCKGSHCKKKVLTVDGHLKFMVTRGPASVFDYVVNPIGEPQD